ncbi:MAG: MFS transporter [Bacteroidetes bacterium]|nr:MFS transporter [Bacteroidota bacterium]
METQKYTRPFTIFLLMLPAGISQGFVFVTLPYLLTHNGFSVAQTAAIVALGTSPSLFRFVLGPVVDVSLSLRKWYWISIAAIVVTLLLLSVTPFTVKGAALLSVLVFISQVAVNISFLPIGAFMAKTVEESKKGKASGWYQAGGLAGTGIGGGAGLWIANHFNAPVSGIALSIACLAFALIVLSLRDIEHQTEKTLKQELSGLGKDLLSMIKVPVTLFAIILVLVPIGTGAMANLWSAMAEDWKVDADTVALITGLLSGLISSLGCVAGGYLADRRGIWFAYLGSGVACALVTIVMAVMPMQSTVYIAGVLFYAFTMGMIYAAFTSVVLFAIGNKHVATKFSLMGSIGNIPVVYMTSFDGWMHDQYNSKIMLMAEAIIGITFVILFTIVLRRLKYKKLITV